MVGRAGGGEIVNLRGEFPDWLFGRGGVPRRHDGSLHPDLVAVLDLLDRRARETWEYVDWEAFDRLCPPRADGTGQLRISDGYRTAEEQEDAYARGASKRRGFESPHQYGLAVDLVPRPYGDVEEIPVGVQVLTWGRLPTLQGLKATFSRPEAWERIGIAAFLESQGLTWGGRWSPFVDAVHFELRYAFPGREAAGTSWWTGKGRSVVEGPQAARAVKRPAGLWAAVGILGAVVVAALAVSSAARPRSL